jgi:ABC-type nitrate/sulfonate/bicarbonate transport system substrate-binding protein
MTAAIRPRARFRSAILVLLVAVVVGCAQPAAPAASRPAPAAQPPAPGGQAGAPAAAQAPAKPAPQPLRITIPSEIELGNAVLQLGVRNGYFAEEGLAPEFLLAVGSVGVRALVAGEVDVSIAAGSSTQAILGDAPLKITYVAVARPQWWVYGRGAVRTLKDLEGKTLGVGSIRDPSHVGTSIIMERQGADPSKVTAVGMGPPIKRLEGLMIGAIDGGVLTFPDNLRADEEGFTRIAAFPDYFQLAMVALAVREDTLTNKVPMLEALIRAANKSMERFRTNKEDAVGISLDVLQLDRARAEQLHEELGAMLAKNGIIDENTQRTSIKIFGASLEDLDTDRVPLTKVFDFSLAERVARNTP